MSVIDRNATFAATTTTTTKSSARKGRIEIQYYICSSSRKKKGGGGGRGSTTPALHENLHTRTRTKADVCKVYASSVLFRHLAFSSYPMQPHPDTH